MERKRAKSTVTLERQMLKYLLKDKFVLQGRLSSCREEWFSSEERAAIFEIVRRNYETSKNCVSETRFKFLLDTVFASEDDETLKKRVQTEFEVVQGTGLDGDVGSVVASLNEALMGTRLEDLLLESFDAVQHGDVEGALAKLKQGTMMLNSGTQDDDEATPLWGDKDDAWKRREMDVRAHPELYAGIKTGFKKYDDLTGGLFPAELYLIFGLSGKGKSSVMKQIAINVSHQGKNVLLCANEENKHQIKTKLVSNETQTTYRDWKLGRFTDDDMRKYEEMSEARAEGAGNIYIYTFKQQTDASCISRKLAELKARGVVIDLLIVDYLDLMSSIVRAYNENDEGGRVAGDLKQIAIDFNIPVLTCTQANTSAEKQETKDKPFLHMEDMFGTKKKIHNSNLVMGITNKSATVGAAEREGELVRHKLVVCVPKNRDGGTFTFTLVFEVQTGYIHDDDGEFDAVTEEQERNAREVMKELDKDKDLSDPKALDEHERRVAAVMDQLVGDPVEKDETAVKRRGGGELSSALDSMRAFRRRRK